MPGYKHPCRYCSKLVAEESNVCPFCGKVNPVGPLRCAKCLSPIEAGWKSCGHCSLSLTVVCPTCAKLTFFGDYCDKCGERMVVTCPKCRTVQPPIGPNCAKCGKPLRTAILT